MDRQSGVRRQTDNRNLGWEIGKRMAINIGIVGAGGIGEKHCEAAMAVEDASIAVIADPDLDRAQVMAGKFGARAVKDADELFADDQVDAVVIGVPNCFHKPLAIAAMRAGKDVLLEKPMGLNVAECDAINQVAKSTGRLLQIGLVHRYTKVGAAAQEIAMSGALGNVYHARADLCLRRSVPGLGGWFTTKSMSGGGALIDLGVHLIDLSLFILGFPQPTSLMGQTHNTFGRRMKDYVYETMWAGPPRLEGVCDVDDAAHALIRFSGGLTLELNVTWAGNFPDATSTGSQMGFYGDQGGISFALFGDKINLAREEQGRNVDTTIKIGSDDDFFKSQMADFTKAIGEGEVRGATGEQARAVQSIIDAIYESSESQKVVEF